jgi:hypothetical protein
VLEANARHSRRTWHPAQIAFASSTWAVDRPVEEMGKNKSGSADPQAASERQFSPGTSSRVSWRLVDDMH